ncbi:hypothetical protein M0802_006884 [Mischocyttarus mexicanus]|nr:hypothetical protein M0802_006884 [Mischocyttarus mexicanus]
MRRPWTKAGGTGSRQGFYLADDALTRDWLPARRTNKKTAKIMLTAHRSVLSPRISTILHVRRSTSWSVQQEACCPGLD